MYESYYLFGLMCVWGFSVCILSYQSYTTSVYRFQTQFIRTRLELYDLSELMAYYFPDDDDQSSVQGSMNGGTMSEGRSTKPRSRAAASPLSPIRTNLPLLCGWRPQACVDLNRTSEAVRTWNQRREARMGLERSRGKRGRRPPVCDYDPKRLHTEQREQSHAVHQDDAMAVHLALRGSHFRTWWRHVVPEIVSSAHQDCQVPCVVTYGAPDSATDLVVDSLVTGPRPAPRSHNSSWPKVALLALETGRKGTHRLENLARADLLATWLRVSDVPINYMYAWQNLCEHLDTEGEHHVIGAEIETCMAPVPTETELAQKQLGAAFVSNCKAKERYVFMRALFKTLAAAGRPVDNWGSCLHTAGLPTSELQGIPTGRRVRSNARPAPGSGADAQRGARKIALLETRYKFAFAFENSIRHDYATEKLLHPILAGVVPVVWGAPEACDFVPGGKRSCINALDYESPDALAAYLLRLDRDHELYLSYFDWRSDRGGPGPTRRWLDMQPYSFTSHGRNSWPCRLCVAFHDTYCR